MRHFMSPLTTSRQVRVLSLSFYLLYRIYRDSKRKRIFLGEMQDSRWFFSNINRITLKFMFVVFWCSPFLSSVPSISIRNIWHFKINSRTLRLKYSLGASIHKSSPFDCWAVFVLFHELYDGVTWNNFSQWKIQDWRDCHSECWWEDSPGWVGDYWQVPKEPSSEDQICHFRR